MKEKKKKRNRFVLSAWVAGSAILILVILLALMSLMQYQVRKRQAIELFTEKGATLIQSFEAGLRNRPEVFEIYEDYFYMQKLLMETAQQPDIDYMVITDSDGTIIADSDPSMLEKQYGLDLDAKSIAGSTRISWRLTSNPGGAGTFEVYRGFSPNRKAEGASSETAWIVFVGFNMEKIEAASREDTIRAIIWASILVSFGSLAIVLLFLAQTYRLTRASLSRVQVFSDALVKNMPIALLAVDKAGKIVTCNAQARGLLSLSSHEAIGTDATVTLTDALLPILQRIDQQTKLIEEDVVISSAKDGEFIWEVVAAAFADDNDVAEGKILLARNVTEVRRMEKDVAKSRHLNAIGSLAAGVAHEIRNPLSSIRGFAVYFKGRLAGNTEDEETADIMIAETERLNRVISQLIEFARPLALRKEPTDIANLARETVKLILAEAKSKSIEVDVQAAEDLPHFLIDPDKIRQVLLNIFLNALAAMPAGGRLSIGFVAEPHALAVIVSDTGEGIDEESLPMIYDPYFTSKPAGTGLGLAVVQKMMEAHGGTIHIESQAKGGTKVMLRFERD